MKTLDEEKVKKVPVSLRDEPIDRTSCQEDDLEEQDEVSRFFVSDYQSSTFQEVLRRDCGDRLARRVEYHIHLSPAYRVPVLYLCLRDVPDPGCSVVRDSGSTDIGMVYRHLVPAQYQSATQEFGLLGGITQGVSGTCAMTSTPLTAPHRRCRRTSVRRSLSTHAEQQKLWPRLPKAKAST